MKNENGSVLSSCLMGVIVFIVGFFTEPLLMVLGSLIVVTGGIAKFVENRRLKFMALEAEKKETQLQERVA